MVRLRIKRVRLRTSVSSNLHQQTWRSLSFRWHLFVFLSADSHNIYMSHFRKILTSRPIAFFGVRRSRSFKDLTITPERNEMERFFRCRLVIYRLGYQGSKVRTLMIQKTIFWPFQLNELTWRGGAGVTLTIDSRPASSVEDQGHRKFKHIFPWGTDQECFHCHHFRTNDHNNMAGTDVHV